MEIQDLSWKVNLNKRNNHKSLPRSIRGLIVGKSGCGKTTLMMNLLLNKGWLDYDNLLVFGKSLFQPEYKMLKECLQRNIDKADIMKVFQSQNVFEGKISATEILDEYAKMRVKPKKKKKIDCAFFESADDVPDPRELDSERKNLIIFDDLQLERQNKCESYYVRGRHSNVDCFYLAQNYFKLPRQTIRDNSNFIILFKQDAKNINHIYNDHASFDWDLQEFRKFCNNAWEKKNGFVVIDLSSAYSSGKFRTCLDN